jgi:hypothetical protein
VCSTPSPIKGIYGLEAKQERGKQEKFYFHRLISGAIMRGHKIAVPLLG